MTRFINNALFTRLPADVQAGLTAAAREAAAWHDGQYEKIETESQAQLQKLGVTITHPDLAPFRKAVEPIFDKYARTQEIRDLVARIRAAQ